MPIFCINKFTSAILSGTCYEITNSFQFASCRFNIVGQVRKKRFLQFKCFTSETILRLVNLHSYEVLLDELQKFCLAVGCHNQCRLLISSITASDHLTQYRWKQWRRLHGFKICGHWLPWGYSSDSCSNKQPANRLVVIIWTICSCMECNR